MRPRTLFCAVAVLGAAVAASAQVTQYSVEFQIYHIENQLVHQYDSDAAVPNAAIESRLDSPVSFVFEQIHVTDILDFIERSYDVRIEIDDDLIAPPNQDTAGFVTDGMVAYINLKDVTLRQGLAALLHPLGLGFAMEKDRIRIYDASGTSPISQNLPRWYVPSEQWVVVESGSIRIGKALFSLDSDALPAITEHSELELLGRPVIAVPAGQRSQISIDGAVQYLVQDPDDQRRFQLRSTEEFTGLSVNFVLNPVDESTVECDLDLKYSYVSEREILAGTTIRAGKPDIVHSRAPAKHRVPVGQPIAMFRKTADSANDTLLILMRVSEAGGPATDPKTTSAIDTQYLMRAAFAQIRGEPDWGWWTRSYARSYRMYEGAGRVLGPASVVPDIELTGEIDWKKAGFIGVKHVRVGQEMRVVGAVNHRKLIREGIITSRYWQDGPPTPTDSVKDSFSQLNSLYESVTGQRGPFDFDRNRDFEGFVAIIDALRRYMAMFECETTDVAGRYRLGSRFLVLDPDTRLNDRGGQEWRPLRLHLQCSYEVDDESTVAFLFPIENDDYLVVLAKFEIIRNGKPIL